MSEDRPNNCDCTYNDGHQSKCDVDSIDCAASVRRVLVPLSTLWSAHTRTVVQVEIIRTFTCNTNIYQHHYVPLIRVIVSPFGI